MRPQDNPEIHPHPTELGVRNYEGFMNRGVTHYIPHSFWKVGVDENNEYVFGCIKSGAAGNILCSFLAPRADLNEDGRVKLRIDGDNASEIVPIYENDPLNKLFFEKCEAGHIRNGHTN